jgi:hypothetical protein
MLRHGFQHTCEASQRVLLQGQLLPHCHIMSCQLSATMLNAAALFDVRQAQPAAGSRSSHR